MSVLVDGEGVVRRVIAGPLAADEQGFGISVLSAALSPSPGAP